VLGLRQGVESAIRWIGFSARTNTNERRFHLESSMQHLQSDFAVDPAV
jgi:hypothetical protein